MSDEHILTIEFEADNEEELNILIKNLQKKYPIACKAKYGVRINGWSREALK